MMRGLTRWIRLTVVVGGALAGVAVHPQTVSAAASAGPDWDFWDVCVKQGDYFDAAGRGYHKIFCLSYGGDYAYYWFPHGEKIPMLMI
jgi:hypothetical protein